MEKKEFQQRKFRAGKYSLPITCDKCGREVSSDEWCFEKEKGWYDPNDEGPLRGEPIKHVEEKTVLCRDCVPEGKVTMKSQKILGEKDERKNPEN